MTCRFSAWAGSELVNASELQVPVTTARLPATGSTCSGSVWRPKPKARAPHKTVKPVELQWAAGSTRINTNNQTKTLYEFHFSQNKCLIPQIPPANPEPTRENHYPQSRRWWNCPGFLHLVAAPGAGWVTWQVEYPVKASFTSNIGKL